MDLRLGTHLVVNRRQRRTFSVFESSYHLLLPLPV